MKTAIPTKLERITAEQFLREFLGSPGVELVRGRLVRLPMSGTNHGGLVITIAGLIQNHVKRKKLGRVVGGEVGIHLHRNPDTFRAADIAFISFRQLPAEQPLPKGLLEFPPELVVEVRSPTDRHKAVREKVEDYLSGGVKVVMVVDPETESVAVFRDDELPMRFSNGDAVKLPDVLPGFSVPVKQFFL